MSRGWLIQQIIDLQIAAIALTMRKRPGLKPQDVAKQVAVRREDRVRLVKGVGPKSEISATEGEK